MTPDGGVPGQDDGRGFVVSSEVTISPESAETLERAFGDRLHLVEKAPGFQRLETWRDVTRPGVFQLVSWWTTPIVSAVICGRRNTGFRTHGFRPNRPSRAAPGSAVMCCFQIAPDS
jgi:heme-degrading monooxygenase HmoA